MTLVIVMPEVAVTVLKAVVPPLAVASAFVPVVPLVWSQARKVTEPVVPFCPSGTNRRRSTERSSSAFVVPTVTVEPIDREAEDIGAEQALQSLTPGTVEER